MSYPSLFLMALLSVCSVSMQINADEPQKKLQQKIEQSREKREHEGASIPREELKRRMDERQTQGRKIMPDRTDDKAKANRQKGGKNLWAKRISKEKIRPREERINVRVGVVRNQFIQKREKEHIFDRFFWDGFKRRHRDWFFDTTFNWSSGVTWPNMAVWLSWNSSRPMYYYYGEDGSVYYGRTQNPAYLFLVPSGADFIDQAVGIASRPYPLALDEASWKPLGIFGLDQGNGSGELMEYVSLAINQQGFLKGAYFNAASGDSLEIQGSVDPKNQRAAWKFVGQDWPVMESGFYNLTQDDATLFVYRSGTERESRAMIRLN